MVLGIGEGRIDVTSDKANYSRGETINCTATLRLSQPTEARRLKAQFQRIEGSGKQTQYFDLGLKELGPARVYRDGERFEFSFLVDERVAPDAFKFSGLTGMLQMFTGSKPVHWEIEVALDMKMKFDISGKLYPAIQRPVVQK